jgi:hypothetical protein
MNYSTETLELLEDLEDNCYAMDDMIEFIEQYGEEDFRKYYEYYVELGEKHSYDAVDAFIKAFGIWEIASTESFNDAYYGEYDSQADFAQTFYEERYDDFPTEIAVDWQQTWEQSLRHDFQYQDGFIFNRNY